MSRALLAAVYVALSLVYLLAFRQAPSLTGAVVKTLPILLLAALATRAAAPGWRAPLAAALACSALGDFLLDLNALHGGLFTAGLGSFLLAQLLYAWQFWRNRGALPQRRLLALGYLPVAAALAWVVIPAAGALALPVGAYLLAITAMVTGAAVADRPLWLFAGALSFAASDGMIALTKFELLRLPFASLAIMVSYYLAQWLIWHGATSPAPARVEPAA
jgi:uncharacterized membrane protein YhhN